MIDYCLFLTKINYLLQVRNLDEAKVKLNSLLAPKMLLQSILAASCVGSDIQNMDANSLSHTISSWSSSYEMWTLSSSNLEVLYSNKFVSDWLCPHAVKL